MFSTSSFSLSAAVQQNRTAIRALIGPLVALLAAYGGLAAVVVPRQVRSLIFRVLRPAESAVRRLIVIMVWDVAVKPVTPRSRAAGGFAAPAAGGFAAQAAAGGRRAVFKLFDPPQRALRRLVFRARKMPRIIVIDAAPPVAPMFAHLYPQQAGPSGPEEKAPANRDVAAQPLCRRLKALMVALDDLPRQAQRMARRRAALQAQAPSVAGRPVLRPVLRAGAPPGHRKIPLLDIDRILAECHRLARQAEKIPLAPDTC